MKVRYERVTLEDIPAEQRQLVGTTIARFLEHEGSIEDACDILRSHIDNSSDSRASRWLLARLVSDPNVDMKTCKRFLDELLGGEVYV